MIIDTQHIITKAEAAKLKGLSIQLLNYYLKRKDAPAPLDMGDKQRVYFNRGDIEAWQVKRKRR